MKANCTGQPSKCSAMPRKETFVSSKADDGLIERRGSHFRPNKIGSVSINFRDFTMPCVSALYFLKCGVCRCDSYAASSLYVSKILIWSGSPFTETAYRVNTP